MDVELVFGGGVCCFDCLFGGDLGDGEVLLVLLCVEFGFGDDYYDFDLVELGFLLCFYSEVGSGGGGSFLLLYLLLLLGLLSLGDGGVVEGGFVERRWFWFGGVVVWYCYEVVMELGLEEVCWFFKEDKRIWKFFIGYDLFCIEFVFWILL